MACSLLGSIALLLCAFCTAQKETPHGCRTISLSNGFFTERKNKFSLNENVRFRCQSGYTTPNGDQEGDTQCLETGWSPEPKCIKTCPKPSEENAVFDKTQSFFLSKEILRYECKDGFQTTEGTIDGHIQCTDNGWDPKPLCLSIECEIPVLEHGSINPRKDQYVNRDVVKFSCLRGYTRVGPDAAQCYHFGWSPQLPVCKGKVNSCQQPPNISNGFITGVLLEVYQHGEKVVYECDVRFAMTGSNTVECVDGEWTSLPSCTELCPPPPQLPNAINIKEIRNYRNGEEVGFTCMEHFLLQGPQKIFCEYGSWQTPPRCVEKRLHHNKASGSKSTGASAGVEVSTGDNQGKQQESVAVLGTEEKPCMKPPRIEHASYSERVKNSYQPGETVNYECHVGFAAEGPLTLTCQRGEWSEPSTCEEATCREPPVVDNADIVEDRAVSYLPGHELHYQCREGFAISGADSIRCENKVWSEAPTCEDVRCPPPPDIPNGQINGYKKQKYLPHEKVRYRCFPGYSLFGSPVITCSEKKWTEVPQCREAAGNCDRAPPIENGDITEMPKREYRSGDTVQYKCQRYYRMEGNEVVRCYNGHWSETPRCLVPCTTSEEDLQRNNIMLRWTRDEKLYSESGDAVEFTCRWGYRPDPSSPSFRVQCIDGTFEYPRCI